MIMPQPVSPYIVAKILSPFFSLTDKELSKLIEVDLNDTDQVSSLFAQYIVPHVSGYDFESKDIIRKNLSYFIKVGGIDLERIFDAFHLPFEAPKDSRCFLEELWSSLFGDEKILDINRDDYIVENSAEVANSLYKKGYRESR